MVKARNSSSSMNERSQPSMFPESFKEHIESVLEFSPVLDGLENTLTDAGFVSQYDNFRLRMGSVVRFEFVHDRILPPHSIERVDKRHVVFLFAVDIDKDSQHVVLGRHADRLDLCGV